MRAAHLFSMACCKVCCGCKECDEGEEGKCCCGSECCAADTYCCNAECVEACSEGQEGDCKCADACCYQDEYCCDGECVEACGEGDAGPCKCSSDCCAAGEYCCDGVCQAEPCCTETECREYTYESPLDDETGDFSTFAIGTCGHSDTTIESLGEIGGVEIFLYTTLVTITCECLASFEAATGPLRGPDAENPGDPISYEVVSCPP